MSNDEVARIEVRCQLATSSRCKSFIEGRDHDSGSDFVQTSDEDIYLTGASGADRNYIAHARQDIPALIAEVLWLQTALVNTKAG